MARCSGQLPEAAKLLINSIIMKYCEAADLQIFYKCPIFVILTAFFRENENSDAEMIIFTNHESYLG